MSNGMEVSRTDSSGEPLDIDDFRRMGGKALVEKKAMMELANRIKGMEWGSGNRAIQGSGFSPETRMALAEFCRVTRAEPQTQVDILGGKPYLNASYWKERVANHPYFVRMEQREIGDNSEREIRERAKRHLELSKQLEESGRKDEALSRRVKAIDLEEEADEIRASRMQWSPRPSATSVVETTIYRFINSTPIDKIKSGEITDFEQYVVAVKECNWAGGLGNEMADKKKWDPIGDIEPGKTARSRSLRRCAVQAFPAWRESYDERIQKAEEWVDAEFEVLDRHDNVVATGGGEVERSMAVTAHEIPQRGEPRKVADDVGKPEKKEPDFDYDDRRKALFATLDAAGITDNDKRKEWAEEQGLPRSTKQWTEEQFDTAIAKIMEPYVDEVYERAERLDVDLEDMSLMALGKAKPQYLVDFIKLRDILRGREGEAEDEAEEEADLSGEL